MSTTLLERFRKNVEAKKDESEFLMRQLNFWTILREKSKKV